MTDKGVPDDLFDQFEWPDEPPDPPPPSSPPPDEEAAEEEPPPPKQTAIPLTKEDLHNAEYFDYEFGKRVLYDHTEKEWFIWHKGQHHWAIDDHEEIHIMARNAAKRRVSDALDSGSSDKLKIAQGLFSRPARQRALDDLRSAPGVGMAGRWNPGLDLFCTANGVIDLRTGGIRVGQPSDLINKASPVRYDPSADCPRWERFLYEVFVTEEMVDYVQTIVGYCMTGLTTEQVWFLLYGTGGNGKSVFMSILQDIFGLKQYFESAAAETFIATRWQSGNNNVAQLKNARLVVASEVPVRTSFDNARLKSLTGDGSVTARELYANNATWVPQLKLMMLVNHLPTAHDDSDGFWRRIRTIPFEVSFIGRENPNLIEELRTELPGILNWCVRGAVTWFRSGLSAEPANATTLRAEYRAESDPVAQFINDCIVETRVATDTVAAREMYRIYLVWSASAGVTAGTETNFGRSEAMKSLGLGTKRTSQGVTYQGVKVYEPGVHQVSGVRSED
jgi:putative DNA primase/helicase